MTEDTQGLVYINSIIDHSDGGLKGSPKVILWAPNKYKTKLEGDFTVEELECIIAYIKEYKTYD